MRYAPVQCLCRLDVGVGPTARAVGTVALKDSMADWHFSRSSSESVGVKGVSRSTSGALASLSAPSVFCSALASALAPAGAASSATSTKLPSPRPSASLCNRSTSPLKLLGTTPKISVPPALANVTIKLASVTWYSFPSSLGGPAASCTIRATGLTSARTPWRTNSVRRRKQILRDNPSPASVLPFTVERRVGMREGAKAG